jgi:Catalase
MGQAMRRMHWFSRMAQVSVTEANFRAATSRQRAPTTALSGSSMWKWTIRASTIHGKESLLWWVVSVLELLNATQRVPLRLSVNRPHVAEAGNYSRDGAIRSDGNYGREKNYEPNSFGGPQQNRLREF